MLLPAMKRSLPSLSSWIASSRLTAFWVSLVKTAHSSAEAIPEKAARGSAAAPQQSERREIMVLILFLQVFIKTVTTLA